METTGPVLAIGTITVANESVIHGLPVRWKILVGTAIAAGLMALAEHAWPRLAKAIAWTALGTVVLSRVDKKVPSPAESILTWWNGGEAAGGTPTAPAPQQPGAPLPVTPVPTVPRPAPVPT